MALFIRKLLLHSTVITDHEISLKNVSREKYHHGLLSETQISLVVGSVSPLCLVHINHFRSLSLEHKIYSRALLYYPIIT